MALEVLFHKKLRKTDISNDFIFKTKALAAFGFAPGVHNQRDFQAFDADNVPWMFRLTTRAGLQPKPVILKSYWHPFVVAKQLREGDRVTFLTEETVNGLMFHVRAEREFVRFNDGDDSDDGGDEEDYVEVERLRNTVQPVSVRW